MEETIKQLHFQLSNDADTVFLDTRTLCKCKKVNDVSAKRSNPRSGVCSRCAVRSTQYAVGLGAKRSTHTVDLANMGGGDRYLWCKKVKPTEWGMQ